MKVWHRVQVFREYFPKMEEVITLECVWETDTYVLVEKAHKINSKLPEELLEESEPLKKPVILYQSVEAFLGGIIPSSYFIHQLRGKHKWVRFGFSLPADSELDSKKDPNSNPDLKPDGAFLGQEEPLQISEEPPSKKPRSVAFISVKKPVAKEPPTTTTTASLWMNEAVSESNNKDDDADPFFSLLAAGTTKGSLFWNICHHNFHLEESFSPADRLLWLVSL